MRKIDVLEGFDCVCYGKAVCRCKGKGRCEQIADFFFETQANPDLALAETIPHEFEKPNKPKDVVDPHPLRYLFDDNDMSDFMFADYTDYVKYELIQEHTGIHWNLCSCPRLVLDFIENKLAEKTVAASKFGITTSPIWRMTKKSTDKSKDSEACTMTPHCKEWANMFVLYTNFGQFVGDLEVTAIATFRFHRKVVNVKPGKEGYAHDHPSFFYMLTNSIEDIDRLARLRNAK